MIKWLTCLMFCIKAWAFGEYSLSFVHLGKELPAYAFTAIQQARYMNEDLEIYLLVEDAAYQTLLKSSFIASQHITLVNLLNLPLTTEHATFRQINKFNKEFREGFWSHAAERFFYLHDFMVEYKLEKLFHFENDCMLYVDVKELVPLFEKNEIPLAATFQSLVGCVPCFVFIQNSQVFQLLIHHMLSEIKNYRGSQPDIEVNDMSTMASFREKFGDSYMLPLPILMPEYGRYHAKRTVKYKDNNTPLDFLSKHAELFPGYLFDAAALGIYANGHDRRNEIKGTGPGVIHYKAIFDPGHFSFFWGIDSKKRKVPYLHFNGQTYRITNLHLHSKMPGNFTSYGSYQQPFPTGSFPCEGW